MLIILYGWSRMCHQKDVAHEGQISLTAAHTMVDWFNFCREVCEQYLEEHPISIGGLDENGFPKTVEIDESYFFHRKYHRGMWREGRWVFGGVERETGKCFLVEVENRNAATLHAVIQTYVL